MGRINKDLVTIPVGRFDLIPEGHEIIDKRITDVIPTDLENKLLLITCYPFDAIKAGGPLRYIVVAKPEHIDILNQNKWI